MNTSRRTDAPADALPATSFQQGAATLQAHWIRLGRRRQAWLLAGAAALGLYVLLFAWSSVVGGAGMLARDRQLARQLQQQLQQVQVLAGEVRRFESGNAATPFNMNRFINSSVASLGLRPSRIQPNARGETQIRFENVGFADLVRWLHQVENTEGVLLREVSIQEAGGADAGGAVRATVRLGQASGRTAP